MPAPTCPHMDTEGGYKAHPYIAPVARDECGRGDRAPTIKDTCNYRTVGAQHAAPLRDADAGEEGGDKPRPYTDD